MVRINNTDLSNELRDVAKIQLGLDMIPNTMGNQVIPVVDVNPKHARTITLSSGNSSANTGVITGYTAPTDRDVFITNITFGLIKDVACDMATGAVSVKATFNTSDKFVCAIPVLTLTAQNVMLSIQFDKPIKLDRSGTVTISGAFAAGACYRSIFVQGYEVFTDKA